MEKVHSAAAQVRRWFPANLLLLIAFFGVLSCGPLLADSSPGSREVLSGLRKFYAKTSRRDGSFLAGTDPSYRGISDSAYSDLAPVTYAVIIHQTLGWELPKKSKTIQFLLSRQHETGEFFNVAGTVDPKSAEGRAYN